MSEKNVPAVQVGGTERALIEGDLAKLTEEQRQAYYLRVCESLGLNPMTQPFGYISFQGKLKLYAKRDCTDQLRKLHSVSVVSIERHVVDGVLEVRCVVQDKTGRRDEDVGALVLAGKKGDDLANAIMKCVTKAKRRATLSICGLGWLDETETETVPGAVVVEQSQPTEEPKRLPAPKKHDAGKLAKRLTAKDSELHEAGLCERGNLLRRVREVMDPQDIMGDIATWLVTDDILAKIGEVVKEYEAECKNAMEQASPA